MVQPEVEQQWTHKQLGGVYTVADVDGGKAVMVQLDSGRIFKLHIEQLNEHFQPIPNAKETEARDPSQAGS